MLHIQSKVQLFQHFCRQVRSKGSSSLFKSQFRQIRDSMWTRFFIRLKGKKVYVSNSKGEFSNKISQKKIFSWAKNKKLYDIKKK